MFNNAIEWAFLLNFVENWSSGIQPWQAVGSHSAGAEESPPNASNARHQDASLICISW